MLTPEQLELRTRTLGASEIAAVVGLSPRATELDVFSRKRRGRNLEEPPITMDDQPDTDASDEVEGGDALDRRTVGSILEAGIVSLYEHRTGAETDPSGTVLHPEHPWRSATPDRVVRVSEGKRGLECKLVGRWMAKDWPTDGAPDYVVVQCQWSMHVCDADTWDVASLVDGTSFRICRIRRDDGLIGDLVQEATRFWEKHVLANKMPKPSSGADLMRLLRSRWKKDNGTIAEAPKQAERLAKRLSVLQERKRKVDRDIKLVKSHLAGLCGENMEIEADWGRFAYRTVQGAPMWKAIAEELAGGPVDDEVVDRFRADPYRKASFHPGKELLALRQTSGTK